MSTLYLILFLGKNSHLLILSLSYDNDIGIWLGE